MTVSTEPNAHSGRRGTARDRRSLGVGRGVRVSRGRTLATTVRCALMPEDILEDSLACGDGSGGKGQSLARATGLDKSGKSGSRAPRKAPRRGRCERRLDARRPRDAVPGSGTPWRPSHAPGMAQWPRHGVPRATHASRKPTVRARRRSGDFPLTSLANRPPGARARHATSARSVRDTGRVSWQCTHRSHGVDGHHSGHVVDGLCAFMKQLARAGALKSQSGRSKRGALVGREFIPGVLIRRGPSRSIRSTASVIAHTLTFRGPRSRRLSCGFLRHYSDGSVKPHQKWAHADHPHGLGADREASSAAHLGVSTARLRETDRGVRRRRRERPARRAATGPRAPTAFGRRSARRSSGRRARGVLRLDDARAAAAVGVRPDQAKHARRVRAHVGVDNREKRRELCALGRAVSGRARREEASDGRGARIRNRRAARRDDKDDERRSELLSLASDDAVAFVHVRFEVEADDAPVVYAYELQCDAEKDARGRAWGVF